MTTTCETHTVHCIEMAVISISENNFDSLVDRFPGRVWTGNREIADVTDALIAAGEMTAETTETAVEWLANGNVSCVCR